jgi:hypothetical protein
VGTIENPEQLAAFFGRSLGPAREHAATLGYDSVYDAMTASRCYTEDTCTMDPACPFVTGCEKAPGASPG